MENSDTEKLAILQDKMRTLVSAMKEERATNASTIEELQNELNTEKEQNEVLQDKIVKLVELVKVERKKAQDAVDQHKLHEDVNANGNIDQKAQEHNSDDDALAKAKEEEERANVAEERAARAEEKTKQAEERAKKSMERAERAEDSVKVQTDSLRQDIKQLKEQLQKMESDNQELSEELNRHKGASNSQESTNSAQSVTDAGTSNSNDELADMRRENDRLAKALKASKEREDESNAATEAAIQKADTFETKLSTLVTILKDLKAERAAWQQQETDLQSEIRALKGDSEAQKDEIETLKDEIETLKDEIAKGKIEKLKTNITTKVDKEANVSETEYKAMQQKVIMLECEITKLTASSDDLLRDLNSSILKLSLAERSCDRLRDEIERLQTQTPQTNGETSVPPPAPSGPPKLPPPPPPPPVFKKFDGKLKIKKSTKKTEVQGNPEDNLKAKLLDEISKGVTLRKVQPSSQPKAPNPANGNEMFSLGAMASMLAKKRMQRISMRIDADDPLKGSLDTLLMELNHKE